MSKTGIIYGVNGPVIYLKGDTGFKISEMVYVGPEKLVGEVIGLKKHMTTIQVFEETTGLKPGETVIGTGDAISVLLGPGIIHNIFDGIQRPLAEIAQASGKYISRGVSVDSLDTEKKWDTHITVKEGDVIGAGTVIAETQETASILHKSMVPPTITHSLFPHHTQDLHAVSPLEIQFTNATIVHDVLPFLFKTYPTIPFPEQSDSCLRFLSRTNPEVLLFIHFITNFYELQLKKCQIR